MVMDLKHQIGALRDRPRELIAPGRRHRARRPASNHPALKARTAETWIAAVGARKAARFSIQIEKYERVVDDPAVAGPELYFADEDIAIEIKGKHKAFELVRAIGSQRVLHGHVYHTIRLPAEPAFRKDRRSSPVRGITFGSTRIDPSLDESDLDVRQTPLIREVAISVFRLPRGHVALLSDRSDEFRPLRSVLIGQQ